MSQPIKIKQGKGGTVCLPFSAIYAFINPVQKIKSSQNLLETHNIRQRYVLN